MICIAPSNFRCDSCASNDNVLTIYAGIKPSKSPRIALCSKCRKEMYKVLPYTLETEEEPVSLSH